MPTPQMGLLPVDEAGEKWFLVGKPGCERAHEIGCVTV